VAGEASEQDQHTPLVRHETSAETETQQVFEPVGDAAVQPDPTKPARALNAIIPVIIMVAGTIGGIGVSGVKAHYESEGPGAAFPSLMQILHNHVFA
jgi:hypothetical protein